MSDLRISLRATAAGLAATLPDASSTLAPRYERPAAPTARQDPQTASADACGSSRVAVEPLRQDLRTDPKLRQAIEIASENNRDLAGHSHLIMTFKVRHFSAAPLVPHAIHTDGLLVHPRQHFVVIKYATAIEETSSAGAAR